MHVLGVVLGELTFAVLHLTVGDALLRQVKRFVLGIRRAYKVKPAVF